MAFSDTLRSSLAIFVLLLASNVEAQMNDAAGLPAMPCEDIIAFKDNEHAISDITRWTEGFATGLNFGSGIHSPMLFNLGHPSFSSDAIHPRILAACYENPDEILMFIVIQITMDLPTMSRNSLGEFN